MNVMSSSLTCEETAVNALQDHMATMYYKSGLFTALYCMLAAGTSRNNYHVSCVHTLLCSGPVHGMCMYAKLQEILTIQVTAIYSLALHLAEDIYDH